MAARLSICIATHNRAQLLRRAVDSVLTQKVDGCEVIVVDDGSNDETPDVVQSVRRAAPEVVRYIRQSNLGRPHALNAALGVATGELITILDDDDWFTCGSIEGIHETWRQVAQRDFVGVVGRCATPDKAVIGTSAPESPWDGSYFDARLVCGVRGDRKEVVRRDLVGGFSFNPRPGERRVPTSLLWYSLSARGQMRFVDDVWVVKDYQANGMTDDNLRLRVRSAGTNVDYYGQLAEMFPRAPLRTRVRIRSNQFRFALHAEEGRAIYREFGFAEALPACLIGSIAWMRDLHKLGRL